MASNFVPRVVLSHAGVQYSYKTARALHRGGMLCRFYTPLYYRPDSLVARFVRKSQWFPRWLALLQERRYHPEIPSEAVYSVPWFEIAYRLWSRLFPQRYQSAALTLQNAFFDRYVAHQLQSCQQAFDIFYGFSGSALYCLKKSKSLGKITVLDHHDIHHASARQLLQEEIELHPDFAETIPYWPPYEPYLERLAEEDAIADYHITLSSFARETYLRAGIQPERVFVVPLGVDLSRFRPSEYSDEGVFRVLFVGAIGQGKGIKYLLEAFKRLSLPKAELILAGKVLGSGRPLAYYEGWFRHQGYIEPSRMPEFYWKGSVFVLPSLWDSYGQVVLEAMACGLPVIVSEHTLGRDVVREGIDGFVIPIRDVEALCEKLLLLYKDREIRSWMGRNAAEQAHKFSLENYAETLTNILLKLWLNRKEEIS